MATRTFNLTGPGQSMTYVCSDFARQMAGAVLQGQRALTLRAGNVEARRDFSSVHDGMLAYRSLLENGQSGHVYNVCSGHGVRISEIVEMLGDISGLKVETKTDPKRLRKVEVQEVRGDPTALQEATGLRPGSLKSALNGLFHEWLDFLKKNTHK